MLRNFKTHYYLTIILTFITFSFSDIILLSNGLSIQCTIISHSSDIVKYVPQNINDTLNVYEFNIRHIIFSSGDTIVYNLPSKPELKIPDLNTKSIDSLALLYYSKSHSPFVGAFFNYIPLIPITHFRHKEYESIAKIYGLYALGFFGFYFGIKGENKLMFLSSSFVLAGAYCFQYFDGYKSARRYNNNLSQTMHFAPAIDIYDDDPIFTGIFGAPVATSLIGTTIALIAYIVQGD